MSTWIQPYLKLDYLHLLQSHQILFLLGGVLGAPEKTLSVPGLTH